MLELSDFDFEAETDANEERIKNIEKYFGNDGEVCFFPENYSVRQFWISVVGFKKLSKTGRVLVGEGVLMKMCRKKTKPRYFFLLNDILVYGTSLVDKKKVWV